MQTLLNAETMDAAKGVLSDDWGERKMFGAVYMVFTSVLDNSYYYNRRRTNQHYY